MKAFRHDDEIQLSKTELQLLIYLMENAKPDSFKRKILSHVWDNEVLYVDDNTVFANISRLRNKIGAVSDGRYVLYSWNFGNYIGTR